MKKKLKRRKEKQRVDLSSSGEFGGFFFYALEGSSRFGCDEVEAKSRKSNEFPCKKKKELGPRNMLNDSQTDFYFSRYNAHGQA